MRRYKFFLYKNHFGPLISFLLFFQISTFLKTEQRLHKFILKTESSSNFVNLDFKTYPQIFLPYLSPNSEKWFFTIPTACDSKITFSSPNQATYLPPEKNISVNELQLFYDRKLSGFILNFTHSYFTNVSIISKKKKKKKKNKPPCLHFARFFQTVCTFL